MKRIIVILLILATATSAHAIGVGAYCNYNGGLSNYVKKGGKDRYHLQTAGGGLALELVKGAKAGRTTLDWRVRAGAEGLFTEDYSPDESYRINVSNYFLFGGFERGLFRLSFGPLLGMRYIRGEKAYRDADLVRIVIGGTQYICPSLQENRRKIDQWALCLGLSLNVDFNLTDSLVLFAAINAEQNIVFHKNEVSGRALLLNTPPSVPPVDSIRYKEARKTDMATEGSVNLGVMFRITLKDKVDDNENKVDESEENAPGEGSVMKEPPGEG